MAAYGTIAQAEAYLVNKLNTTAWDNAGPGRQNKALGEATNIINRLNFQGTKTVVAQDNEFPRDDDTDVPSDITNGCIELALALLDGVNPDLEFENLVLEEETFGNAKMVHNREVMPEHIIAGIPSITAWRYIRPYLRDTMSVRMDRV